MVHDLAGKNTNFSAVISIEFYYAIAASAGWATTAVRSHSRRKELERLRARTKELEAKLVPDDDRADVIDEDEA